MPATQGLLRVQQVTKRFASASGEVLEILKGVDLDLERGESVAILGPSGCGKSTLLNLIGTLDRPTSGSIQLAGRDLAPLNDLALAALRNREIGFIFQMHHLLPHLTVLENVLIPTLPLTDATAREAAMQRARPLLERVGLGSRINEKPGTLSGGERQRAAVVRALINRPALLLADEPTGALDRASAETLTQLLLQLNREESLGMIVVTHSIELARKMSRVIELRDGRVIPAQLT